MYTQRKGSKMLLQATHIHAASNLDASGVTFALHNNDYTEDSVKTATFAGMTTNGSFVYNCTYFDTDTGKDDDCMVYVHYTNLFKLVADY
jgi:hypothetical protein